MGPNAVPILFSRGMASGTEESWGLAKYVTDEAGLSCQRHDCPLPTEK